MEDSILFFRHFSLETVWLLWSLCSKCILVYSGLFKENNYLSTDCVHRLSSENVIITVTWHSFTLNRFSTRLKKRKENRSEKICILSTRKNTKQDRQEVALIPCGSSAVTNQDANCQLMLFTNTQIHRIFTLWVLGMHVFQNLLPQKQTYCEE